MSKETAIQSYLEGKPVKNIAVDCNVLPRTVHRWLRTANVPKRKPRSGRFGTHSKALKHSEELVNKAVEMYKNGQSAFYISLDLGVGASSVLRWVKASGIKVRPQRRYKDDVVGL